MTQFIKKKNQGEIKAVNSKMKEKHYKFDKHESYSESVALKSNKTIPKMNPLYSCHGCEIW